jgi:hypothetical protein
LSVISYQPFVLILRAVNESSSRKLLTEI